METQRFDTMTRAIAARASRRAVLRGLAGAAGGALGLSKIRRPAAAPKCDEEGVCPDPFGDPCDDIGCPEGQICAADADGSAACVDDVPSGPPLDERGQALWYLDGFASSPQAGEWPAIAKEALVEDMRRRIDDPFLVKQGGTPLCGPAAIVFELVRRDPIEYVQTCRYLYEAGATTTRVGRTIEAPARLRELPVPVDARGQQMSPADWLILSSLRYSDDRLILIDLLPETADVAGISLPDHMEDWAGQLLGLHGIGFDSTFSWGELDAIRKAQSAVDRNGVAFLLIDSEMVDGSQPSNSYPDHWAVFLGGLAIGGGVISFDLYSWGRSIHVDLSEDVFEDSMWGAVTALP